MYTVFYYTSPEGFQGIMERKKIRFKDRFFMNDKSEVYYTLELLKEHYSTILPAEFQDEGTKSNLCINSLDFSNSIIKKMWLTKKEHSYIFGHKVIYSVEKQIEIRRTFIDEIYRTIHEDVSKKKEYCDVIAKRTFMNRFESILERVAFIGAILKHPKFGFEEKYRIFIYLFDSDGKLYLNYSPNSFFTKKPCHESLNLIHAA